MIIVTDHQQAADQQATKNINFSKTQWSIKFKKIH